MKCRKRKGMKEFTVIGSSPPRVDALEKVTGKAKFTADYKTQGMLHLKVIGSSCAHARIVQIDTSKAEGLLGVRGFLRPEDVPPKRTGELIHDRYVLPCDGVVRFIGEPILLLAADSADVAEDAADLVEIRYEELPAVFDVDEAMNQHPPVILHPDLRSYYYRPAPRYPQMLDLEKPNVCNMATLCTGDVEKGFEESDLIIENDYSCFPVAHCPLEPHITEGWMESDGTLTLSLSSQGSHPIIDALSDLYDISPSKVRVLTPYCGGGFGSKATNQWLQRLVSAAILKFRRPVRLRFTREEEFIIGFRRTSAKVHIKDGVKRDGTLVAREARVVMEAGAYAGAFVPGIPRIAAYTFGVTYRIPNIKVNGYVVYTNNPPATIMRGAGAPQPIWAIEQQMDMIAEKLNIDPVALRKKNILCEGEENAIGEVVESIGAKECLEKVADWIQFDRKPELEGDWVRGKGMSVAGSICGRGYTATSVVKVHSDGVIEVRYGSGEMGQGASTVMAQIAAEELGVPMSQIKVVRGDTATTPWDFVAQSSHITMTTGNAVMLACRDAKRQIFELAAVKMGLSSKDLDTEDLEIRNGMIFRKDTPLESIPLTNLFTAQGVVKGIGEILGRSEYTSLALPVDPETGQGEKQAFWSYGAYAAEVGVNLRTGEVRVFKVAGAFDMGQPINVKMCEQQIDGGVGMGIGTAIYEELVFDRGVVRNPNFVTYKIPTFAEIPSGENMASFIVKAPHKDGPYGAKGFGEIVLGAFAPAIGNALYNAIGVRVKDLPLSRERVLKVIKSKTQAQT